MSARADEIIDRRRLRRKLSFWRIAALALAALAIGGAGAYFFAGGESGVALDHIAKVKIEGTITEDEELLERLERVAETDAVEGVILYINSPGGTTVGGEAIFEAVRDIADEKPVVAQVGTLAASAGYMIASAADHIVSRQSSIVGSIGVLIQYPDITEMMDSLGVKVEGVKSSPLKAEPSPFTPTTPAEREMLRALVEDSYDWFVDLVVARRGLERDEVLELADGSIFTGRQALGSGLVDSLGGEETAVAWLESQGLAENLDVIEWEPRDEGGWLSIGAAGSLGRLIGLDGLAGELARALGGEALLLDGLVSVWHPQTAAAEN